MPDQVAMITGVTGQDGAYLAELLLEKGYVVHRVKPRSSFFNTAWVNHLYHDPYERGAPFYLHYGGLTDATNLVRPVQEVQPSEIYNLAAQSEALRILKRERVTRFYQASTSELYGNTQEAPQRKTAPFHPRSPYAAAKLFAYWIAVNYGEA
jgi:GDPmannose 4,6-dehydratase